MPGNFTPKQLFKFMTNIVIVSQTAGLVGEKYEVWPSGDLYVKPSYNLLQSVLILAVLNQLFISVQDKDEAGFGVSCWSVVMVSVSKKLTNKQIFIISQGVPTNPNILVLC